MNIHHLELFYYVARHGGISQAVRHMPYGIQQPAISAQILQLEDRLGVALFQRRPFQLTAAGQKLYGFIEPFFSRVEQIGDELRGAPVKSLRIGASEVVLTEYLPRVLQRLRAEFKDLKVSLRGALQPELEDLLLRDEIDIAVSSISRRPMPGIRIEELLRLPLVLLARAKDRARSAEELWGQDRIDQPLVSLPPREPISQSFQEELAKRNISWLPSIEVNSLRLVETYVSEGYGLGLTVDRPHTRLPKELRKIALAGFPSLTIGALWRTESPLTLSFLGEIRAEAAQINQAGSAGN